MNCSNQTGPEERFGQLALIPEFESSAAYIVPVDSLRITLTRSNSTTIALDTVIGLAGEDSVDLEVTVTLLAQTETFFLVLKIVNSMGDTVFSAGPDVVTATGGSSAPTPTPVTIVYVGVGSDAADVQITTVDATVLFGDTVLLEAVALDNAGVQIPGTPIRFVSTDEAFGTFPDDEIGRLVGGSTRGPLSVIAELLTGPADTATVLVQPIPSSVVIVSGNGQPGDVQTELTDSIVVQVNGSDGLGVQGVSVAFSTPDGGTLTPDIVITDAQGQAASAWVLGNTVGAQTAVAEVVGAAGAPVVTFTATAKDLTRGSISGRVFRSQDDAPFAGVRVVRSGPDGDTEVVTDASGNYDFSDVPVGTHSVLVMSEDLPPFGSFVVSGVQQVTITGGLVVEDVDFAFRAAEVEVRTIASVSNAGVGAEVEITMELDLTEIPLPMSGINGTIEWPTAVAGLVPGSATAGDVWIQTGGSFLTNESPPGTLLFVGVSPTTGITDDVFTVLTFRVTTVAAGSADFPPNLAELEVFDPNTGASTKLLNIVFLRTTAATVTVQ